MSNDISVLFKAQDSLTAEIQKMRASVKEMGKDVADYKAIQDKAFKEKAELQLDLRKAKEELKELAKIEKDGTEESKQNYINKQKEINEMTEGIKRYNQAINESNKAEKELATTQSRNNNNPNVEDKSNLGADLIKAGMAKEIGRSLSNATSAYISSAYGERIGNRIGTIGGSALEMGALGALVGGPVGAAIGTGVGLVKGAIDVATEEKKKADGYFRDEVKNIYTQVSELNTKTLAGGIELATQRENDIIAFKNILGSQEASEKFLEDTQKFAAVTPFGQKELLELGKGMMVYGYKQDDIIPELTKLGDAFSALGIDQEGKGSSITALGRMKSSEKTDLKNINVLQGHGIDAIGILADKMETSKQMVYEMISKGVINGAVTAQLIIDTVGEKYKGAMEEFSKTTAGLESTLEDVKERGDRSEGEGYNAERKKGLQAEIEYHETIAVKDREYMGQYRANLKNKEEELMRSTIESAKNTQEYKEAMAVGDGAEIGKILSDAQTKAMVEWQNSPEMQKLHEAELARVQATQNYIRENGSYVRFGQDMAEQFNLGWSSKIKLDTNIDNAIGRGSNRDKTYDTKGIRMDRRATGGRIPDDYYPFMADKNERILTASENSEWERNKGKGGGGVIIQSLSLNTTLTEDNVKQVAFEIAREINNARENAV